MLVNGLFVQYQWTIPSIVYARSLTFYDGKLLSSKELKHELQLLGYQQNTDVNNIGDYSVAGNHYQIYSKGFQFSDKTERPAIISFDLENNHIIKLNKDLARLEPLMIGRFYSKQYENRQPIPISQIPNTMVKGLQAIEDRNFKHHTGVDFFGILRAMVRNLLAGKIVQGGSTITQQLVKNRLHYRSKSWLRKVNEALTALLLEKKFDKGEILESYFNEIYWGQSGNTAIHGVKQAAGFYFSKTPGQLSIAEQALLIGIVKGPSWYHPIKQKKRALKRRNIVLNTWYETSVINKQQWHKAKKAGINVRINKSFSDSQYQDFLDLVKQQLSQSFSKAVLNRQGLRIFTTLNPFVQNQLSKSIRWNTNKLGADLQAAGIVSETQTGEILAIKGGKEKTSLYNRALLSKRQIGSLIKPFVYLAALENLNNFTLNSIIADKPVKVKTKRGEYWQPKNYDGTSMGMISAKTALIKSRNQATVNLGLKVGLKTFVNFMQQLGLNINRSNHPSVFLGATELTPLEVTNLFLILSSQAQQQQLLAIKYVADSDNERIGKIKRQNDLKVNPASIRSINAALHKVTTEGTAAKLTHQFGFKKLYGKTGTTNEGKNSWFVGFDNHYLATFWIGKDNNTATHLTGSSGALLLWADWYKRVK
jgi:penicillin-binding protein 1B